VILKLGHPNAKFGSRRDRADYVLVSSPLRDNITLSLDHAKEDDDGVKNVT
jgi:hypothetical protein